MVFAVGRIVDGFIYRTKLSLEILRPESLLCGSIGSALDTICAVKNIFDNIFDNTFLLIEFISKLFIAMFLYF